MPGLLRLLARGFVMSMVICREICSLAASVLHRYGSHGGMFA